MPTLNMYNINKDTKTEQTNIPMDVGIKENCKLQSCEVKFIEKTSENVLQFTFTNSNNEVFTHTEWKPDETKIEYLQKRVGHILNKYVPEEKLNIEAENWEDFIIKVCNLINESDVLDQEVRLKLTYSKKGKIQFPLFPAFIEVVTDKPTMLRMNPKYDILVLPSPTVMPVMPTTIPGLTPMPSQQEDDLPF